MDVVGVDEMQNPVPNPVEFATTAIDGFTFANVSAVVLPSANELAGMPTIIKTLIAKTLIFTMGFDL